MVSRKYGSLPLAYAVSQNPSQFDGHNWEFRIVTSTNCDVTSQLGIPNCDETVLLIVAPRHNYEFPNGDGMSQLDLPPQNSTPQLGKT